MKKIILASGSPRRKQLLEWAEVPFDVVVSDVEETFPDSLPVYETAIYIAHKKAAAVRNFTAGYHAILAADTIVVFEDEIIGKPKDREDAIAILSKLSGQTHRVITGVVILQPHPDSTISFLDETEVTFHDLSLAQIEFYVDKYKPYDKAGAYGIQEWIGIVGIKEVHGDFYNVMGLPVSRVMKALQNL